MGISKKSGRHYPTFRVCPVESCKERPPKTETNEFADSLGTASPGKDRLIVRQNALAHATELVKHSSSLIDDQPKKVMEIAEILERWVFREDKYFEYDPDK